MKTAATRTRTFPARPVATVLLACAVALVAGSTAAQAPDVTDAEMRDLRVRAAATQEEAPVPRTGFTEAELRDVRDEAQLHGNTAGGGPAFHGLTAQERADLRSEATSTRQGIPHPIGLTTAELRDLRAGARTMTPLVTAPGFSTAELADLRSEARTVVRRSAGPVRAFTPSELRDLRSLAHGAQIARIEDRLAETR